jgi:hypothetical protein
MEKKKKTTRKATNQDWINRLMEERNALNGKLTKLEAFINSGNVESLEAKDQELLYRQKAVMRIYLDILNVRISRVPMDKENSDA